MTRTGMRVVPKSGNPLSGFTALTVYEVISGTGEVNMSPFAVKYGLMRHSDNTANVVDDNGNIRFISMQYFREFNLESRVFFRDSNNG